MTFGVKWEVKPQLSQSTRSAVTMRHLSQLSHMFIYAKRIVQVKTVLLLLNLRCSHSWLSRHAEPGAVPSGIRRRWRTKGTERRLSGYFVPSVLLFACRYCFCDFCLSLIYDYTECSPWTKILLIDISVY